MVRARLDRLRRQLDDMGGDEGDGAAPDLPSAAEVVTAVEEDPDTPEAPFPVGYGAIHIAT